MSCFHRLNDDENGLPSILAVEGVEGAAASVETVRPRDGPSRQRTATGPFPASVASRKRLIGDDS